MTIEEVIDGYRNYKIDPSAHPVKGNNHPPKLIFHYLLIARSKVLREKYINNKSKRNADTMYQHIPCIPLKKTNTIECPCIPPVGCSILKTKFPIAKMITPEHMVVTSVDSTVKYDYVSWDDFEDIKNSVYKYEREGAYYTMKSMDDAFTYGYFYATKSEFSGLSRKAVSFRGLLENFLAAKRYSGCSFSDQEICDPYGEEFLIHMDLLNNIYMLTENLIRNIQNPVLDVKDNDLDDSKSQNPQMKGA